MQNWSIKSVWWSSRKNGSRFRLYKNRFKKPKICSFPKGLDDGSCQKIKTFSIFVLMQNRAIKSVV